MKNIRPLVVAVTAAVCIGTAAFAAEQNTPAESPAQKAADSDFGRVSKDGFNAFNDIRMARIAIFDGNTGDAKSEIDAAVAALNTAKNDDSIYVKAESELKTPAGVSQPQNGNAPASVTKVQWLPIDGAMTLDENYVATKDKAAGVAKANTELKSGDKTNALETLRLAGVDVSFDMEVAPLQKTLAGVDKAEQLADAGHWYQANQALKSVQDNIRFDVDDFSAVPKTHANGASATTTGSTQKTASTEK